ncbi:MAG TPA: hypothetical protein DCG75_09520 [Bacteroidales bacterium]|nr:hypothetical protein [Bacteroidales bacterium]
MKRLLLISIFLFGHFYLNAQSLGIVESKNYSGIYDLFKQKNITVHYYEDNIGIVTGEYKGNLQYSLLDEYGFENEYSYFIHYTNEGELVELKKSISEIGEILFHNQSISVLKIKKASVKEFVPVKNEALVHFDEKVAYLPENYKSSSFANISYNQDIASMINEIKTDSIEATISYLSAMPTRDCYSGQIIVALNWINSRFTNYGLDVTTQELSDYQIPSFNVIATQQGTTYPEEYVVVGGHADSRSVDNFAPGADDNASGIGGVLEIARILSQYSFDRTIIYCAFSGEEYGLYGSGYFASQFRNEDKNIIGYINLDMIGYKDPDQVLHSSLIYPPSALGLADYYKSICSTYLPNFNVFDGVLSGGSSDHASFNNQGYMGIFPFEDAQKYSPYIHTREDLLGTSVNSFDLAKNLTSAALATVATLADQNATVSTNDHLNQLNPFVLYPNPASDYLTISFKNEEIADIEIFSILGQSLIRKQITGPTSFDISSLSSGTYIIRLTSENHSTSQKILVN